MRESVSRQIGCPLERGRLAGAEENLDLEEDGVAFILALGANALWAFALVLSKPALASMSAIAYGFVRPLIAAFLVLAYALATDTLAYPGLSVLGIAILGGFIGMFLGVALFMYAVKRASAHIAGTLTNIAPLWGVTASVLWLHEEPHPTTFAAVALVIAGVYLLALRRGSLKGGFSIRGAAAAIGASMAWGVSDTAIARWCLLRGMTLQTLQLVSMSTAAVCWGIVAVGCQRTAPKHYPWSGMKYAVATSVIGLFIGMLLWYFALGQAPASVLSPIRGSVVVFVFLWSMLFLGERPTAHSLRGAVLILGGVLLVSFG